jgi:uncharacterized protein
MKRVVLVHGWGGSPEGDWFQWLKNELESRDFKVLAPEMPDTLDPKIGLWVSKLQEVIGDADEDTYLVGHSIGCQAIMRYFQTLKDGKKVGGAIFVAGWFSLTDETWDEDYTIEKADPWVNTPLDFEKIKKHTTKFLAISSDNDPWVPLSDADLFKERLNAEVIIEKGKGHFSGEDGTTDLPIVLDKLEEMAK